MENPCDHGKITWAKVCSSWGKKIEMPLPVPRRNISRKMLFPNVFIYFKETVHKFCWGLRACISRPFWTTFLPAGTVPTKKEESSRWERGCGLIWQLPFKGQGTWLGFSSFFFPFLLALGYTMNPQVLSLEAMEGLADKVPIAQRGEEEHNWNGLLDTI